MPEFNEIEVAFTDISQHNLDTVTELYQRDIQENGLSIQIQSSNDRKVALKDAKYVICTIRVDGLEGFATDVDIPLKYGVDQCVGDMLCAGGIIYGQRGIAEILDICKDIRELGAPDVLLLNYSNPMAMLTAGLLEAFEKLPSIVARKRYGPTCFAVLAIHHRIERPFK